MATPKKPTKKTTAPAPKKGSLPPWLKPKVVKKKGGK